MRKKAIVVTAVALVVGLLALYVGGGWGIVIVEASAVILASILTLRSGNDRGDDHVAG